MALLSTQYMQSWSTSRDPEWNSAGSSVLLYEAEVHGPVKIKTSQIFSEPPMQPVGYSVMPSIGVFIVTGLTLAIQSYLTSSHINMLLLGM